MSREPAPPSTAARAEVGTQPPAAAPQDGAFDWGWLEADSQEWLPPAPPPPGPNPARMYDYLLGGKDNVAADRSAVSVEGVEPPVAGALAARDFTVRAVRRCTELGIVQFLDLGCGLSFPPDVHEVARATAPDARVVYVDHDPMVVAHARARMATSPGLAAVRHDLTDPAAVFADPVVRGLLDPERPLAVLMLGVLHEIDPTTCPAVLAGYRRRMPRGGALAVSTVARGLGDPRHLERLRAAAAAATGRPMHPRTASQVEDALEGFRMLPPGVEDLTPDVPEGSVGLLAALGVRG